MYYYTFTLTPSRNKSDIVFSDHTELFLEAVENINNGLAFKRDGKTLSIDASTISGKSLIATLSSVNKLTNPARSLSALTRYLTTYHTDVFKPYVYNKTLFSINLESQSCSTNLKKNKMTHEELLKAIIDLLYTQKDSKEKRDAIKELENIVKPFM